MKKGLLLLTCLTFFILTTACEKANQVALMSAKTWVVTDGSAGGTAGDEYRFFDNRIFMINGANGRYAEGDWEIQQYNGTFSRIYINANSNSITGIAGDYEVETITGTELKLQPQNTSWGSTQLPITFRAK